MPKVSILLPTYQSDKHLKDTLCSIASQTFQDYELLIIDDGSTDQTLEIIQQFSDKRVRIVEGNRKGLADALNVGIMSAEGEYIARIDADDIMTDRRLEKQVVYMEKHPEVAVCGGWQQYFGLSTYLHAPPASADQCRANLLFRCDLCHSTVMLRRSFFIEHKLLYNSYYAAEDFELWTRVLCFGEITNLQEVIGLYREDGQGITKAKMQLLMDQNGEIVAASLKRNLQMTLDDEQKKFFTGWSNPFYSGAIRKKRKERMQQWENLKRLFLQIYEKNKQIAYYNDQALLKVLRAEWMRLRYNMPFQLPKNEVNVDLLFQKESKISQTIKKVKFFCRNYRGAYRKYKKIKSFISKTIE